jgi:hypothetical protein
MIGNILQLIAKEVSAFIDAQSEMPSGQKSVVLHKPNSVSGDFSLPDNAISLSMLNIEEELSSKTSMPSKRVKNNKVYTQNPAVHINLQIIFISNFANDYINELNYLTKVLAFFQEKSSFTVENTQGLEALNLQKLSFKLNTLPLSEQGNVWTLLGGKYMPSLVYRVGLISIQDKERRSDIKVVKTIDINSDHKKR